MTPENATRSRQNVTIIERAYEAFRRRDLAEIFSLLASEVEIRQSGEIPWGGRYTGHAEAALFFGKLTQAITSTVTLERLVDAGDQVVALGRTRGTVNANGRSFDVAVAHVWTVQNARIVRVEYYIDNPTMLAALT